MGGIERAFVSLAVASFIAWLGGLAALLMM
jgi:hypothetical protein